jgi:hypothetical protein
MKYLRMWKILIFPQWQTSSTAAGQPSTRKEEDGEKVV